MRRTLLTVAAFAVLAGGVGCATDQLMPAPGTAHRAASADQLDTTEPTPEPVARPAMPAPAVAPETTAPAAPTLEPAPAAGAAPRVPSRRVPVEVPAPVTVNPSPAPVAAPPAVLAQPAPVEAPAETPAEPVLDEPATLVGPCYREDAECYEIVADYFPQLPGETDGRAIDPLEADQ